MIYHTAVVDWIGLPKTTEKAKRLLCFSFLWTNFLYSISKLCIKNLNLDYHIRIYFILFPSATLKDENIVKLNRIAIYSYCLFTTCVIEWCMGLFFL